MFDNLLPVEKFVLVVAIVILFVAIVRMVTL